MEFETENHDFNFKIPHEVVRKNGSLRKWLEDDSRAPSEFTFQFSPKLYSCESMSGVLFDFQFNAYSIVRKCYVKHAMNDSLIFCFTGEKKIVGS